VRYHGVLASRSKHRRQVVPQPPPDTPSSASHPDVPAKRSRPLPGDRCDTSVPAASRTDRSHPPSGPATGQRSSERLSRPSRYYSWSELMRRVFEIDVLRCPRCDGSPMRILATIHSPEATRAILESLGLPTRAPPIAPARHSSAAWTLAEPTNPRHVDRYAA
jgi:hypothetical protein